jgi:hypothetical protein
MSWYLRSFADQDTHHASVSLLWVGEVIADCGVVFRPLAMSEAAVEVGADDPGGVYVALCGRELLAVVTFLTESCRQRCARCSAELAQRAARQDE